MAATYKPLDSCYRRGNVKIFSHWGYVVWLERILEMPDPTPEQVEQRRQARRRENFRQANASNRLEGIEPDAFLLNVQERLMRGEITAAEAVVLSVEHHKKA
jgi:hypothetical protein